MGGEIAAIRSVHTAARPGDRERWRLGDDVLFLVVHDGSGRLIDLGGEVSAVTESGAAMLERALHDGVEPAVQALADRYQTDPARIRADMHALLQDLAAQRILQPPRSTPQRDTLRRSLAWSLYPLMVLLARRPERWMPAKAWLLAVLVFAATRTCGWSRTVRVCETAAARLFARRAAASDGIADGVDAVVAQTMARHPLPVTCKERALCAFLLARAGGLPARMSLGVELFPFGLHCWCEHDRRILADRDEGRCDRFTPIVLYG